MKDWIRNRETRIIRDYEYGTDNLEMPITKLGGKDMEMKIKKWKRTVGKESPILYPNKMNKKWT